MELDAAIILVAHDRWFLEAVGTSVLELEAGRSRFFPGPWHAWRREEAAREIALGKAIEKQQAEIARMERFVERFRYKATKARQAQSRVKRARQDRADRARPARQALARLQLRRAERTGRVVLELEDGRLEVPGRTLLEDGELWLERGEHVSLVGPERRRQDDPDRGARRPPRARRRASCARGHNVKLGYLSQHAEELGTSGTVLEAAQRATGLTPEQGARRCSGRFLFCGEEVEKPLDGLSGGERRRLSLAMLVSSGANVLILDEPTNHLDLDAREALEDALPAFEGAVLLVSHDRALLDAVGTRTVAFEDGAAAQLRGRLGRVRAACARSAARPRPAPRAARSERAARGKRPAGQRPARSRRPVQERSCAGSPTSSARSSAPRRRSPRSRTSWPTRRSGAARRARERNTEAPRRGEARRRGGLRGLGGGDAARAQSSRLGPRRALMR